MCSNFLVLVKIVHNPETLNSFKGSQIAGHLQ
uniref:Uncharacterized protein n=1 Tax=Anguilla anguilla TaxID=7936 RepID=A0A0E9T4Y4_ANGAN